MAKTWVVVADSSRARILLADGPLGPLTELEQLDHPASRSREQDLTSDLPGRAFDSAGAGRHAMEPHEHPKHHEAEVFARQLGERLNRGCLEGDFDKLVLAAAPAFLGLLRRQIGTETEKLISEQIDKNLVALEPAKLRAHLPYRL
jgi:protein required for attachment to host cells